MSAPRTVYLDVANKPKVVFGYKGLVWWGTIGLITIEGTMFVLLIASYFFLRGRVTDWPPGVLPPTLFWGTLNMLLFLASIIPNLLTKKAAKRFDLAGTRLWLTISTALALVCIGVRVLEFPALNVSWDTNAYGSVVWVLIGVHTFHLITDAYDTIALNVLAFTGPMEGKRFIDFSDNAMYWFFVVGSWVPIYAVIYFAPRFL